MHCYWPYQAQVKCTKLESEVERLTMELQLEKQANLDVFTRCKDLEAMVNVCVCGLSVHVCSGVAGRG